MKKFFLRWSLRTGPTLVVKTRRGKICFYLFCHRREDRSIKIFGRKFLCARCSGLLFGFIPAVVLLVFGVSIPRLLGFLLVLPSMVDGCTQFLKLRESTNLIRLTTGILFTLGLLGIIEGS